MTQPTPALRPISFLGWAPHQNQSQLQALPVSEAFHGPSPGDPKPQLLHCHPKSFPLGPRPPWAHLSMPVRAPAHLHRCPSAPESPAPALTCPNHLSFKAQCKGHFLQGASPTIPSPAPCSYVARTPMIQFTQPALHATIVAMSVSLLGWELTADRDVPAPPGSPELPGSEEPSGSAEPLFPP